MPEQKISKKNHGCLKKAVSNLVYAVLFLILLQVPRNSVISAVPKCHYFLKTPPQYQHILRAFGHTLSLTRRPRFEIVGIASTSCVGQNIAIFRFETVIKTRHETRACAKSCSQTADSWKIGIIRGSGALSCMDTFSLTSFPGLEIVGIASTP